MPGASVAAPIRQAAARSVFRTISCVRLSWQQTDPSRGSRDVAGCCTYTEAGARRHGAGSGVDTNGGAQ